MKKAFKGHPIESHEDVGSLRFNPTPLQLYEVMTYSVFACGLAYKAYHYENDPLNTRVPDDIRQAYENRKLCFDESRPLGII